MATAAIAERDAMARERRDDGAKIATIRSVLNPQKLHLCHVS